MGLCLLIYLQGVTANQLNTINSLYCCLQTQRSGFKSFRRRCLKWPHRGNLPAPKLSATFRLLHVENSRSCFPCLVAAELVTKACNCLLPVERTPGNTSRGKDGFLSGRVRSDTVCDVSQTQTGFSWEPFSWSLATAPVGCPWPALEAASSGERAAGMGKVI